MAEQRNPYRGLRAFEACARAECGALRSERGAIGGKVVA